MLLLNCDRIFYNMKKIILIAIAALPFFVTAQSLSPTVIASWGKFTTTGGYSLSQTAGETMIETFSSANNFLTQGFQQPEEKDVAVQELSENGLNIKIYPNPTMNEITVQLESNDGKSYSAVLYDVLGRLLQVPGTMNNSGTQQEQTFDMTLLAAATYFVCISDDKGQIIHSFKVQKINY